MVLALGLAAAGFLVAHAHYAGVPGADEAGGWRLWNDQGLTITAARAWEAGDLSPAQHWYPPGYPLLGALGGTFGLRDRFLLPDLASLVLAGLACASLGGRLFEGRRVGAALGAFAFLIASVGTPPGLRSWLVPWSTTPAAAATLWALVAVLRLWERPGQGRALLAGLAAAAVAWFRPTDAIPVGAAAALFSLPLLAAPSCPRRLGLALAAAAGGLAGVVLLALTIRATSGFGPGTYYALSAAFGFEPRLLPLRWVTLMVDPRPLFDGVGTERAEGGLHRGLAGTFPWVVSGLAGAAACLAASRRSRAHVLLALWLALHLALVLSYRDLHLLGFWLYGNYHYLKVVQPILLLLSASLAWTVLRDGRRWLVLGAALATVVAGFGWRATLVPRSAEERPAGAGLEVPDLNRLEAAAAIPATGGWSAIYAGAATLRIGDAVFRHQFDFKFYPRATDLLMLPLRPLPAGAGTLDLPAGLSVRPEPVRAFRQAIRFGLPCLFDLAGPAACGTAGAPLIPGP